jgi:hypothetical protein
MVRILLLSVALLLVSCDDGTVNRAGTVGANIHELEYNGHRYLRFTSKSDSRVSGFVHDPDCPKCIKVPAEVEKR